jgi:hypothetical protein
MQPQKAKDFVNNLKMLNNSLTGLIQNMRKDISMLENSIAENRRRLHRPYLDRSLRGTTLLESIGKFPN